MWTRAELKYRAKDVLRGSYWKALLVSLLLAITSGQVNYSGSGFRNGLGSNPFNQYSFNSNSYSYSQFLSKLFFSTAALATFASVCIGVFAIRVFRI